MQQRADDPGHAGPLVPGRARFSARGQRRLVALVQVLGLAVWFSATAIAPSLRTEWALSTTAAVWLTASVQVGFAVGAVTSSTLGLADRVLPQRLMAASALGAAVCTAVLALAAHGPGTAVPLRALTGFFLAGVYPVGMKLTASWVGSDGRGRAFGVLIGALTLGSAMPHLVASVGPLPWRGVMLVAAAITLVAAGIAWLLVRPGPLLSASARPHARYALEVFRERRPRLANLGYFGHMWELYAFWTWLSAFLVAGREASGRGGPGPAVSLLTFAVIGLAGAVGALVGGVLADRRGRSFAATSALVVSGACCLASPWAFTWPQQALVPFLAVWGAAVIADSGVFSTALSESVDQRFVGTALTVQTAIGFALTVVTIQLAAVLAARVGWQFAFLLLAPGPLAGAVAMWRFGRSSGDHLGRGSAPSLLSESEH
ncbi:MFS transporter [Intrasporangium flavum]|uniref:MFS transporter n=1 Tax=Intrasporangium flavum TaxID=1428657 RepID=UPI0009F97F8F|nr:MFS transporter [Intrasporangium flavum]